MKRCHSCFIAMAMLCLVTSAHAQSRPSIRFGRISPADFDLSKHEFDTSAAAVIIADIGESGFEGNNKNWFSLVFKRHKRIKILNKNGLDAATIEINLFLDGSDEEKLENLKAYTYNLENGKVIETRLESSAVFKDKVSKNHIKRKFTFPAVKEGSIIEFTYTILSDFMFNLQPWTFQGEYPVLWSEYNVAIPELFNYVFLSQGYQPYVLNKRSTTQASYNISTSGNGAAATERFSVASAVVNNQWAMKDVPALKTESFTSTLANHLSKIEFQLSQIRLPNQPVESVMGDWPKVNEQYMKAENFGASLNKNNNWLDDEMATITAGATTPLQKAQRIYAFVRDHFTCTDDYEKRMSNGLRTTFKNRNGNVADINLLLTAMLLHERITANPVLLSMRDRGYTHHLYPLMDRFNYVICAVDIDGVRYLLDAAQPLMGFGKLSPECYNGHAVMLGEAAESLFLLADSLSENKVTAVFMLLKENGRAEGSFQSKLGYNESLRVREKLKEKGIEEFFKKVKTGYGVEVELRKMGIDSLKRMEEPVLVHYELTTNWGEEDILYVNPMMGEAYKENPFTSAERKYPVEMPYVFDESYSFNLEIPANYTVEEVPKSEKIKFNEDEGYFEYLVSKSADRVMMRCRVTLKKALFMPDEYEALRAFFGHIVKKQSEQIVLKKKNG